ncbi:WAPL domain,Armadillo-like helical,Wings apart-like protein [Cinara cedri]|uniref:WAPL domain,Armadillo-like helical,Wings apart-like protein n=1 Tax=Cinara cedri TaxID=506608 RepID=A0A5E4MI04_9HEMI|nr:WAPL domain,Armadillo-like helical,Wings apart-like protein [Cinara cedri]
MQSTAKGPRSYMKSYGRAKYSNNPNSVVQTAINFDKLLCENTNRPTAAKSAGTVGKWGVTSFTSIRSNNFVTGKTEETSGSRFSVGKKRQHQEPSPAPKITVPEPTVNVIRPKKFFKSRNADSNRSDRKYSGLETTKKARTVVQKTPESSPEKEDRIPEANELSFASLTPTKDPSKPPIVLRIFKGKSQLVNEPNSTQKPLQAIEVPESNDQITPTITTRSLRRRNPQTTYTEPEPEEIEESPPIIDIPKKRRQDRAKFTVPALKINLSKNTIINQNDNEFKSEISEKKVINTNVDKSKIEQLENDRNQLLAVLEGSDDSLSSPKMDVSGEREEEKTDDTDDLLKQLETQFKSDDEPIINKIEEKKEPIKIQSEIPPKVRGIFIETEPIKLDDDVSETMEVEQSEAVIPAKKSIFKSRNERNKKGMFLYKHSWVDKEKKVDEEKKEESIPNESPSNSFEQKPLQRITKTSDVFDDDFDSVTSVKCNRKEKGFYTVVRNVKKAHQIQESGEFQEFNDDVEYILDALQPNNPIGTRCLSAITLATKCMTPAFRMHVKAHGTVAKIFRALHDATKDQSLGMCTATVMFVLSQDRLNMDLDRDCLELMLNLLESDTSHDKALDDCGLTDHQLQKTRERVIQLCSEIKSQGAAKYLNTDNITVGQLAMETLLSLTSARAGEWFKEEMRQLGGLDHIVRTVVQCCNHVELMNNVWSPLLLERIKKVDRCLRILENVTIQNEENNVYLLGFENSILIDTLIRMFKVCNSEIPLYPSYNENDKDSIGAVLRECLTANLKVLINLTHDSNQITHGSKVGQKDGVIDTSLHVLLEVSEYVPHDEKFDIMFFALTLLINLVEINIENRKLVAEAKAPIKKNNLHGSVPSLAIEALVKMFFQQEQLAKTEEKKTDEILDGENKQTEKPAKDAPLKAHTQYIEETIALLVEKAGQNMQHTMLASYIAILLGYITMDDKKYLEFVGQQLPDGRFTAMLAVLDKYLNFMKLTAAPGTKGIKSVEMIIKHLTKCEKLQADASSIPGTSS